MSALNLGFCLRIAASSVDPDRGNPEMKWTLSSTRRYAACRLAMAPREIDGAFARACIGSDLARLSRGVDAMAPASRDQFAIAWTSWSAMRNVGLLCTFPELLAVPGNRAR